MLRAVENTDSVCVIRPCSLPFCHYSKLFHKLAISLQYAACNEWHSFICIYHVQMAFELRIIWQLLPQQQTKKQQYFILQINKTIKSNLFLWYHLWHSRICTKLSSRFLLVSENTWHKSNLSGNLRQAWQSCTWSMSKILDYILDRFFVFFYIMPIIS